MNELEEIKSKIDIVEYIGKYVPLKQAGRNFKGVCPFHNEKTPSFMVSPDKQIFHCFGCNKGGDIFTFTQEIEGVDFNAALKELAEKAGVKLPEKMGFKKEPNDKLYGINEEACKLYENELFSDANKKVLEYLLERGLTEKTIKEFRLGFAPKEGRIINTELMQLGYTKEDLIKAGIIKEKNGRVFDLFFNRITFPIADASGKIVAFTGRVLDDALPKYLNTPETPIYHKSNILYGFNLAKEQIRKQDHAIIVEGNMDVIMSHQAGVKNVVASSGTALTEYQLDLIKRFTKNIKLSFDVDMAGQNATKRAIEMAWEREFNIKVITVPEGKDPADIVKVDPKKWVEACRKAKYVVDYIFDSTFSKYNIKNILDKKQATKELLVVIKKIPDPVEKEHYLKLLGEKVNVSSESLADALRKIKEIKPRVATTEKRAEKAQSIYKTKEEHALSMIILLPKYADFFFNKLEEKDFCEAETQEIFRSLKNFYDSEDKFDIKKWQKSLEPELSVNIDKLVLLTEDQFASADEDLMNEEIFYSVNRLKKDSIAKQKTEVNAKIAEAERLNDKDLLAESLKNFQKLIDLERNL